MTALGLRRRFPALERSHARRRVPRLPPMSSEARWIWLAVGLFVAMSLWWVTQDDRMMDWDSGAHAVFTNAISYELTHGQLTAIFTDWNTYPPLGHFVGALGVLLVGFHQMTLILTANIVFVPLLAFGCFGVGRIAYGPRAGLLAALLALGSPMFVSMMHEYDLDPPQAAMVAVSVWAILASRRFERAGLATLAGVLVALSMLTKQTSVVFLAGIVLVVAIRGGWRNWRGLLAFLVAIGVIAGPWYLYHWHELITRYNTDAGLAGLPANGVQTPPRSSLRNFGWYWWDLANQQVLAPFAISFLIGAGLAIGRLVRRRMPAHSVEPELLGGALVSYLGMTYLTHKDPRYSLPMLVYVAVLATGWIATLSRPRLRAGLSAAVVALALVYFVGMSLGIGGAIRIPLPGGAQNNIIYQRQLTLYETTGWVRGGPVHDADVTSLLDGLKREGVRGVIASTGADPIDFNSWGLTAMAVSKGLSYDNVPPLPASEQAVLILRAPGRDGPPACQTMNDGSRIYVVRGAAPAINPATLTGPPHTRYSLICPGRPPIVYP